MSTLEEKLFPADLAWIILNNLDKFQEKSNMILALQLKFKQLENHTLFGKFTALFNEAVEYYERHNNFPDIIYLNKKLPDGKMIKVLKNEQYSQSLYDELIKTLDYEIIIKKFNQSLGSSSKVDTALCLELSKDLASFATRSETLTQDTKDDWLNTYSNYFENYQGVSTGMLELDEAIGPLGCGSLSTIAAPSGHGKSTIAISIAYNAVTVQGLVVDYVTFEVPKSHMRFNVASIESSYDNNKENRVIASDWKNAVLDAEKGDKLFREMSKRFMEKTNASNGYLNIIDQTEVQAETFEALCSRLEAIAEERKRPADLIIIDNVDNLQVLKSSEADEATRVNQYIIALDKFCKTYSNNRGVHICLLSQVNRGGQKKLLCMENNDNKDVTIDVTCIQKFNALYEKPTTVLVGYSSPNMRANNEMRILPVKLRNKPIPLHPIKLTAEFEYSHIKGGYTSTTPSKADIMGERDKFIEEMNVEAIEDDIEL